MNEVKFMSLLDSVMSYQLLSKMISSLIVILSSLWYLSRFSITTLMSAHRLGGGRKVFEKIS
jgi:hypothetical protein